jgi:hypothetical protein
MIEDCEQNLLEEFFNEFGQKGTSKILGKASLDASRMPRQAA